MQQSTALFKQLNFTKSNLSSLRKSIRHSLQLIDQMHFDPSIKNRSWLYSNEDKKFLLNMSVQQREELVDQIIEKIKAAWQNHKEENQATPDEQERVKLTKTISKRTYDLRAEMKKDTYTDEQRKVINTFLTRLKKPKKNQSGKTYFETEIKQSALDKFSDLLGNSKARSLIMKIAELHNARLEKPVQQQKAFGRTVVMQESFFKLPINNKVVLEDDDYHNIQTSFMKKYFSDFEVEMAMFHGNERAKGQKQFNNHCHIFLNGRNKRTGRYDLLKQTRKIAEQYAKEKGLEKPEPGLAGMKLIGEYRQRMFYEHAQQYLNKHKRNLELYVQPDTEERRELRKIISIDSKRPKNERIFNAANYQREIAKAAEKKRKNEEKKIAKLQQEADQIKEHIEEQEARAERAIEVVEQKREEFEETKSLLKQWTSALDALTERFSQFKNNVLSVFQKDTLRKDFEKQQIKKNDIDYILEPDEKPKIAERAETTARRRLRPRKR